MGQLKFSSMQGLRYLNSLKQWDGKTPFGLERMKALMQALDNPQEKVRTVHIAGTNGKGSVSLGVAACLAELGHKVGLTTSPHLININERIVIEGIQISDVQLNWYGQRINDTSKRIDIEPTFFEVITAAAFLAFVENGLDWAVVEVGLGGRLDATNIISKPEVCLITNIEMDHQALLGNTLELIAKEKAGIIKKGVPVIYGATQRGVIDQIELVCCNNTTEARLFGLDFNVEEIEQGSWELTFWDGSKQIFQSSLAGEHQGVNMALALAAIKILELDVAKAASALTRIYWPGRLETRNINSKSVLIDCAHNPAGIKSLLEHLKTNQISELVLTFGALETKNWQEMLALIMPLAKEVHLLEPSSESAVSCSKIEEHISGFGIKTSSWGREYKDFFDTVIRGKTGPNLPVVITGSIYLIGRIMREIDNNINRLW